MPLINCKVKLKQMEKVLRFWLQMVKIMMMLILIILFLLSNYKFLLPVYLQKINKNKLLKDQKLEDITYQKAFLRNIKKNDQLVGHSDIKRYEEIRKLTTGQGEDYTTGCLSDYEYIKNHCKLISVDSSRQNKLDADLKAI